MLHFLYLQTSALTGLAIILIVVGETQEGKIVETGIARITIKVSNLSPLLGQIVV
jgi:hypothetical protein